MCTKGLWICATFLVGSLCCLVSFAFGPFFTILFVMNQTNLPTLYKTEPQFHFLVASIIAMMWLIFLASCFILTSLCWRKLCLINLSIFLIVVQFLYFILICLYFMFDCCITDKKCFDHTKGRTTTDVGASICLFLCSLVYGFLCLNILFVFVQYKLILILDDDECY